MNILIIIENNIIKKWHYNCLEVLKKHSKNLVFCNFNYKKKYEFRYLLYYLIKKICNPRTEQNFFKKVNNKIKVYNLKTSKSSSSFSFGKDFFKICKNNKIDIIVRFGLGIIKSDLRIPILSFHHGDPSKYRGRPSCFHEILNSENTIGQVVQVLNSKIDKGKVLAFGETKTDLGSFKNSLEKTYSISHLVLEKALLNFSKKNYLIMKNHGKLHFNPNNSKVIKFIFLLFINKIKIIYNKIFYHKKWGIFIIPTKNFKDVNDLKLFYDNKKKIHFNRKYNFIADPFFLKKKLIFEITSNFSQRGKLGMLTQKGIKILKNNFRHISFPSVLSITTNKIKKEFIIPEVAKFSSPNIYTLKKDKLKLYSKLKIENYPKILDPILFYHKKNFFLFGNDIRYPEILNLWIADSLNSVFKVHPSSPLKISPFGSRMAGNILFLNKKIIRVGQNNLGSYGNGIVFYEIKDLTEKKYNEIFISKFNNEKLNGPHTFSFNNENKEIAIDYYKNKFSLFSIITKLNS